MIIGLIESVALIVYFAASIYVYVESKITANCVYTSGNIQYANKCNGYRIYRYLTTHPLTFLLISYATCTIGWISVALMYWGFRSSRSRLLLVHLTAQTAAAFALAGAVVLFSIRAASVGIEESIRAQAETAADLDMHHVDPILKEAMILDITLVILMLVIWVVNLYFLVVIYRCYHYLKDLKASAQLSGFGGGTEMIERSMQAR